MRNATRERRSTGQAIVAAIAGLAFVLEIAFVPLHLAWNDHVLSGASGAHVHTHGPLVHGGDAHRHEGRHWESDDPKSDHEPHSVADHLDQLVQPPVPSTFGHASLALAPQGLRILPPDSSTCTRAEEPESYPRPPPPSDAAPPRAPPIAA